MGNMRWASLFGNRQSAPSENSDNIDFSALAIGPQVIQTSCWQHRVCWGVLCCWWPVFGAASFVEGGGRFTKGTCSLLLSNCRDHPC